MTFLQGLLIGMAWMGALGLCAVVVVFIAQLAGLFDVDDAFDHQEREASTVADRFADPRGDRS